MTEPNRKRKRLAVSCTLCRRRKLRCNKETPCSNCVRSKNLDCLYEATSSTTTGRNVPIAPVSTSRMSLCLSRSDCKLTVNLDHNNALTTPESTGVSIASTSSSLEIEGLKIKIRELESRLSITTSNTSATSSLTPRSTASTLDRSVESVKSSLGGSFELLQGKPVFGATQAVVRNIAHKNRVFGQSHWISSFTLFYDVVQMIEQYFDGSPSKIIDDLTRAKALARAIKAERSPDWPTPLTFEFPLKHVCDELIRGYLRTIEALYRIVHIPTFRAEYEAMWMSDAEPNAGFAVQLKLILAIGASVYDENFSMRLEATRWVYEAQTWMSSPTFKSKLGLQFLQNNILLLLAREIVDIGGEFIWISAGALVRSAVYIGLHKDPTQLRKTSTLEIEMRRRIWNTILEISVQSSLVSGGIPFISLSDFSTEAPGNFDDEQLTEVEPLARPDNQYTQTSVAIALRRTLPARLAVVNFLNDTFSTGTYDATLRFDAMLRSQYKDLKSTLQGFRTESGSPLSHFELQAVDFISHRYLISLHAPYFKSSLQEATYAFSRKVVVDSSFKTWSIACPLSVSASQTPLSQSSSFALSPVEEDFPRLCRCGSGFFRAFAFQASTLIVVELRAQVQEDDSISTPSIRPDLLAVLEQAPNWYLRCIEAGETGIKGYILHRTLNAQIGGLIRNIGKDEMPALLIKAAEEAVDHCLPLLEKLRTQQSERIGDPIGDMNFEISPEFMKDWDFTMSDIFNIDQLFV